MTYTDINELCFKPLIKWDKLTIRGWQTPGPFIILMTLRCNNMTKLQLSLYTQHSVSKVFAPSKPEVWRKREFAHFYHCPEHTYLLKEAEANSHATLHITVMYTSVHIKMWVKKRKKRHFFFHSSSEPLIPFDFKAKILLIAFTVT